MKTVYLAGPITGLSFNQCVAWRVEAMHYLRRHNIGSSSPMRFTRVPDQNKPLPATCEDYEHLTGPAVERAVMTRDRYDATHCDVMLVNFLGATRPSIGTAMEVAWADLKRTPIVAAIEDQGNPHDHTMIREAIGFRFNSLDRALEAVTHILHPYTS